MKSNNHKTYYERNKIRILQRLKDKYENDEDFRNKLKDKYKSRYQTDESYREATIQRAKRTYQKKVESNKLS